VPKQNAPLLAFNRGIISPLALARTDLKRTALSAETQTNWMPRFLGSMMLRPGLGYIDQTLSNAAAIHIPFIFSLSDTAIIEVTNTVVRVRVSETVISRVAVSSAIANGTFDSNLTSWTSADQAGATSAWATGGYMSLVGNGTNHAIRYQQVTVSGSDLSKEHALTIVIQRGPVTCRVGTSQGADDYVAEAHLLPGTHSLAFTPTGNFYVQFENSTINAALVDSCVVASSGEMQLPAPWTSSDLTNIRWSQSADVIFLACDGFHQRRIERRGTRSWSIVTYLSNDGPFRSVNLDDALTLAPSALSGDITITASHALFYPTHVGALFRIGSVGQLVQLNATGDGQWSNPVELSGLNRALSVSITGTWTGTVKLEYSVGSPGSWVSATTYAANTTTTYNDGLSNQIIYYRIGFDTGGYSSGTAVLSLTYAGGSITGIARVTAYSSSTSVSASVLTAFGGTGASANWSEGAWSDYRGYPSAVALYEGRLWWAGKDKIYGSVSDAFDSFDDTTIGDSGPISRSIGSGPVDKVNWLLPLLRLIMGCQMGEISVRSSSLDEPLTPTNFNMKEPSSRGSTSVPALKIDADGIFVRNSRVFLTSFNETYSLTSDYSASDLTVLAPEVGQPSIVRMAVQRYPDTRVHCVRSDGTVAVMVFDPAEDVKCWVLIQTTGTVEDVFVMPASSTSIEDSVYYLVNRTINGTTKRYLEKWALESECTGSTLNKQADSFILYSGASTATITGLSTLEGQTVVVWGDGLDLGTYTVTGGQITLSRAVSNAVVGLGYTAQFKSVKLAYASEEGTALTQKKRVDALGLILSNTHYQGLQYGTDFSHLDNLPLVENGIATAADYIWTDYDFDAFSFNDSFTTDSRLCLQAAAPRPCTVKAAIIGIQTNEHD